ncbi:hypothetical protein RhiJN_17120 [Ceratobasidium sp. AG-Ba]|nr:hypothetical protein RhiJN_17120 [Ceratobasidium sp. AG-Ba]
MDQQSGWLEPQGDGTKNFELDGVEYLPDIVRRKLFVPGWAGREVRLCGFEDAQAGYKKWTEDLDNVNRTIVVPASEAGPAYHHDQFGMERFDRSRLQADFPSAVGPSSATPHAQTQVLQQIGDWSQVSYPSTPGTSSQPQTAPLPPNSIEIEVPRSITTDKDLNVHVRKFKDNYKRQGDKSLLVVCGECKKQQNDIRPTSLARHLASHLEIKKSMSLNDAPRGDGAAELKKLFETKKYARGKPKGHSSPWIRYFWSLMRVDGNDKVQIYCWIINSEKNSSVYHVNPTTGVFERSADGTMGFKAGDVEMLPDIVNRKLYIVGEALVEVRLGSIEDIIEDCRLLTLA